MWGGRNNLSFSVANPIAYITGKCRVIGMGFEVINTTAELNLQGLVTAYRLPQTLTQELAYPSNTTSSTNTPMPFDCYALPPSNPGEALLLPGSKQWDAKRGSYSICTLIGDENPMQTMNNKAVYYNGLNVPNVVGTNTFFGMGNMLAGYTNVLGNKQNTKYYAPFNTSGIYYTGLSDQTTLQVNVKFILESIPDPRSLIATMAKPCTPFNPEALRLYQEVACMLPPGVPQDENPAGEWFSQILGTLGAMATAGTGVNPLFGLIGTGLGVGKTIFDNFRKEMNAIADKKVKQKNVVDNLIRQDDNIRNELQQVRAEIRKNKAYVLPKKKGKQKLKLKRTL